MRGVLQESERSTRCYKKLNSALRLIQRTTSEAPRRHMYFIGLDVHKKTISYCVKDAAGGVHQEGKIGSTRRELDGWIRTMPQAPHDRDGSDDLQRVDL